ncbi:MAG: inositol monophosphatase [Paludibacter sp.]|nr:inositol monophosphatase [Paludibacter sp.]
MSTIQINLKELTLSVCSIAREAGAFMASERNSFDDSKIEHKGLHDLVSYVDKSSEELIINKLLTLLPNAGFIAEEGTNNTLGERFNWIIDPLDGTTNYIHGLPIYSVSIALMDADELVIGVVYEVGHDECFYAWKDGGAYLNDKKISVSNRTDMHQALLATGFPYSDFSRMDQYLNFFKWAMTNSRGIRRLGSAAADLAYVACGRFDAFWEYSLKPWDVAAGALLVKEAGGKVTDYQGGETYLFGKEIVATNNIITLPLLSEL